MFVCRLDVELLEEGACHVLPDSAPRGCGVRTSGTANAAAAAAAAAAGGGGGSGRQFGHDLQLQQQQQLLQQDCGVGSGYEGLEGFKPQWVMLEANTWRKRVAVLQRFVSAARTVVLRLRAQKRLERLRMLAGMQKHLRVVPVVDYIP